MATLDLEQSVLDRIDQLAGEPPFASREAVIRAGLELVENALAELDSEIRKGLDDVDAGRVKPAEEVFDRLIAKYEAMARAKQAA